MAIENVIMMDVVGKIKYVDKFAKDIFLFNDIQIVDASSIRVHQHAANGQKKTSDPVAWVARAAA